MTRTPARPRPLVRFFGGKFYSAARILPHLPPHHRYVEAFAGGLNLLLQKPVIATEIANDLDQTLVSAYVAVRDQPAELAGRMAHVDVSEATFRAAAAGTPEDELDRVVRFLIRRRWSWNGLGRHFARMTRTRGGLPELTNAWKTLRESIPALARRLAKVELTCRPALDVISEHDSPNTLIYADPPYLHQTRVSRDSYRHEMQGIEHIRLLRALRRCRGAVALSGYRSEIYDVMLDGWRCVEFPATAHAGRTTTKSGRLEVLWLNR